MAPTATIKAELLHAVTILTQRITIKVNLFIWMETLEWFGKSCLRTLSWWPWVSKASLRANNFSQTRIALVVECEELTKTIAIWTTTKISTSSFVLADTISTSTNRQKMPALRATTVPCFFRILECSSTSNTFRIRRILSIVIINSRTSTNSITFKKIKVVLLKYKIASTHSSNNNHLGFKSISSKHHSQLQWIQISNRIQP